MSNRENCYDNEPDRVLFRSSQFHPPLGAPTAVQFGCVRCGQAQFPVASLVLVASTSRFRQISVPVASSRVQDLPVNTNPAAATDHQYTSHRGRPTIIEQETNTPVAPPIVARPGPLSQTCDLTTELTRRLGLDMGFQVAVHVQDCESKRFTTHVSHPQGSKTCHVGTSTTGFYFMLATRIHVSWYT